MKCLLKSCFLVMSFTAVSFPGRDVNAAYITGGASQTLGLVSHLKDKLGFAVNHFNPFQKVELGSKLMEKQEEVSCFSAVTIGLALRALL